MVVMSTGQLKWIALVCMFIDHMPLCGCAILADWHGAEQ